MNLLKKAFKLCKTTHHLGTYTHKVSHSIDIIIGYEIIILLYLHIFQYILQLLLDIL